MWPESSRSWASTSRRCAVVLASLEPVLTLRQPLPLYLAQALGVLQDLGADDFSLDRFHARLAPLQESWQPVQKDHWKQRTYFLDRLVTTKHRSLQRHFAAGTNAIIECVLARLILTS